MQLSLQESSWSPDMHFKLDENVPTGLKNAVKGHLCSTVNSQRISGISDKELLVHCRKKNLVLITLDREFADVVNYPPKEHKGLIVLFPKNQGLYAVENVFTWLLENFDLKKCRGRTILVEQGKIRERR